MPKKLNCAVNKNGKQFCSKRLNPTRKNKSWSDKKKAEGPKRRAKKTVDPKEEPHKVYKRKLGKKIKEFTDDERKKYHRLRVRYKQKILGKKYGRK
jgi:hypothetical protein